MRACEDDDDDDGGGGGGNDDDDDDDDDDDVFMTTTAPRTRAPRKTSRVQRAPRRVGSSTASSAKARAGHARAQTDDERVEKLLDAISAYEHASEALTNAEWETLQRERERRRERAFSHAVESVERIERLCEVSSTMFLAHDSASSTSRDGAVVSTVAARFSDISDDEEIAAPEVDVVHRVRRAYERKRALVKAFASDVTIERLDASLDATRRAIEGIRENVSSRVEADEDSLLALDEALRACRRIP